jgi:hypothetical protein
MFLSKRQLWLGFIAVNMASRNVAGWLTNPSWLSIWPHQSRKLKLWARSPSSW